jgi:tripartite-type tricarboxylate transporter receptor subunit TctC
MIRTDRNPLKRFTRFICALAHAKLHQTALLVSLGVLMPNVAMPQTKTATETYPTKAVRLIVPYAPGGPADILSRVVAKGLTERWKQQVVVDNRSGASGLIGAELVARATPDGHTLFLGNSGVLTSNPALYASLPYDAVRDFAPVSLVAVAPLLLVAHPSLGASTVPQLINIARARPGQLTFASGGAGGVAHLAGELLNSMTGIKTVHIAYKGAAPAITDLVAGQVSFNYTGTVTALPHVKSGRLVGVALTTAKRAPALPDIPTIGETVPGYEVASWYGILLPAGARASLIDRINKDIAAVLQDKSIEERVVADGGFVAPGSPEAFRKLIVDDMAKWKKLARTANLKLD